MAEVTLPQLGETVTEGTITQWFKAVGDAVAADEPLFEVSTDKVDTEVPSPVAGTLTEIRVQEGETVEVGAVIAVVGDGDAATLTRLPREPASDATPAPAAEEPRASAGAASSEPAAEEQPQADASHGRRQHPLPTRRRPRRRRLRHRHPPPRRQRRKPGPTTASCRPWSAGSSTRTTSIPPQITGTGPGGRITREDVLDHLDKAGAGASAGILDSSSGAGDRRRRPRRRETRCPRAPSAPPAPAASAPAVAAGERDTTVRLSKIRKLTGEHMVMSKASALTPGASSRSISPTSTSLDRAAKAEFKSSEGFSLTYLPFISRATIDALGEFPHLNASVGENSSSSTTTSISPSPSTSTTRDCSHR